jgi:glycosyltransferase involved in cell wall biosynthesis
LSRQFLNAQEFFDELIQSIVAQTFKDYEIFLIDGGSTDGSSEKARHYAKSYPDKIRYLHHPDKVNLGQGPSRDLGIARATAEFIAFLEIDDVWLPIV